MQNNLHKREEEDSPPTEQAPPAQFIPALLFHSSCLQYLNLFSRQTRPQSRVQCGGKCFARAPQMRYSPSLNLRGAMEMSRPHARLSRCQNTHAHFSQTLSQHLGETRAQKQRPGTFCPGSRGKTSGWHFPTPYK